MCLSTDLKSGLIIQFLKNLNLPFFLFHVSMVFLRVGAQQQRRKCKSNTNKEQMGNLGKYILIIEAAAAAAAASVSKAVEESLISISIHHR